MDEEKTLWCGNLSKDVTEDLLYELFVQVAPLERVKLIEDNRNGLFNYAFVTVKHEKSVPYTMQLLNGIDLFERKLTIKHKRKTCPVPPWNQCERRTSEPMDYGYELNEYLMCRQRSGGYQEPPQKNGETPRKRSRNSSVTHRSHRGSYPGPMWRHTSY